VGERKDSKVSFFFIRLLSRPSLSTAPSAPPLFLPLFMIYYYTSNTCTNSSSFNRTPSTYKYVISFSTLSSAPFSNHHSRIGKKKKKLLLPTSSFSHLPSSSTFINTNHIYLFMSFHNPSIINLQYESP